MSAIAGIVRLDGADARASDVRAMLAVLAHRAPDGSGVWAGGPAALGLGLLATLPGQTAAPVVGPDGAVCVAAVRFDDPDALASALGQRAGTPDAVLALAAVTRWGADALAHAPGDAAVAVWEPAERRLTLARDAMGVRPLCVAYRPGRLFAFASEPRALLALPEVAAGVRADGDEVVRLLLGQSSATATLRRGVERVAPAHAVVVAAGRAPRARRYWALDPEREHAPAPDLADGFRERFDAAVAACLRRPDAAPGAGTAPGVGAALSGGLDSSSVAVTARDLLAAEGAGPLPVFSATFGGLPAEALARCDERAYVAAVVAGGGVEPHEVRADRLSPMAGTAALAVHLDDVPGTYNLYLHAAMFEAARARGLRIFLDGTDGDAAVSHGHARLGWLARTGAWPEWAAEVRALAATGVMDPDGALRQWARPALAALARRGRVGALAGALADLGAGLGLGRRGLLARHALPALAPEAARAAWRRAAWADGARPRPVVRPAAARRVSDDRPPPPAETPRQAHVRGLESPLYTRTLETADRTAAAFGLEMRVPFFDRRLLEFAVALPAALKLGQGWTRLVLRQAMEGRLPPQVQWRPGKSDLSPNFALGVAGPDAAAVAAVLALPDLAVAPYVDVDALRQAHARVVQDPLRHVADAASVYVAVAVEQWLQRTDGGTHG